MLNLQYDLKNDFSIDPSSTVESLLGGWNDSEFQSGLVQACNRYV